MTDTTGRHGSNDHTSGGPDAKVYTLPVHALPNNTPESDNNTPEPQSQTAPHDPAVIEHATVDTQRGGDGREPGDGREADTRVSVVDGDAERVRVDPPSHEPAQPNPLLRAGKRRPILPAWATSRQEFRDSARWLLGYTAHVTAYHALRCPVYLARLAARMPHGTLRLVRELARWASDAESRPVRHAAARREDAHEYLRLATLRDARVRGRTVLLVTAALAGASAVLIGVYVLPTFVDWTVIAGAAVGLGFFGAPADQPVITRAVESATVPKLTSNTVEDALAALGIAGINQAMAKGGPGLTFPKPIARDGKGWRADVDLPLGVTPGDVMERRARLASGLRRPLGCVWPEGDPGEHEGRLILWVGDQDMRKATQPAWPLRKGTQVDLFTPQPFGTDQRGRWVDLTLMFVAVIIGAIPRMGKTFALRELLIIAALDPRTELHAYDLKGTGDLDPLETVAHRHAVGEDDDPIDYALSDLRSLRDELRRRAKLIRTLAKDGLCPENKVTPDLASKQSLGLHPIVIGVDECQVWFEHPDHGGEFEAICTDLVKRGPALGMILALATQRPDAKSLPTGISANASTRFCLKVNGQLENDMVLGTSKYKQGVRATTFSWEDKGIGYLIGEGSDARIVRTVAGLDTEKATTLLAYARALRHQAGTLTGHALGDTPDIEASTRRETLLEDILTVVPETERKVWNERVIDRLTDLRPETYGTYTKAEDLTAALKRHGVKTNQVWGTTDDGKGASRIGLTRADITHALTHRHHSHDTG
jgi:S-DNA-T family DNA segregation ATPase FtsK/SpoIIIE